MRKMIVLFLCAAVLLNGCASVYYVPSGVAKERSAVIKEAEVDEKFCIAQVNGETFTLSQKIMKIPILLRAVLIPVLLPFAVPIVLTQLVFKVKPLSVVVAEGLNTVTVKQGENDRTWNLTLDAKAGEEYTVHYTEKKWKDEYDNQRSEPTVEIHDRAGNVVF